MQSHLNAPFKLIILDRDGVINHDSDAFIKSPDEWQAYPSSLQAIARLNQAGYTVAVATNQSGVSRKLFNMMTLNAIHQKMHQAVQHVGGVIDTIFFCPHSADDNCDCRKPKAGMFHEIAKRYDTNLKGVPCVGDSLRDLQAGFLLGCAPYLVLTGKGQQTLAKGGLPPDTQVFPDLASAVDAILASQTTSSGLN
jgi:D-glycero-D-manno-heptose 1,7-bisphosphate phosphatase